MNFYVIGDEYGAFDTDEEDEEDSDYDHEYFKNLGVTTPAGVWNTKTKAEEEVTEGSSTFRKAEEEVTEGSSTFRTEDDNDKVTRTDLTATLIC